MDWNCGICAMGTPLRHWHCLLEVIGQDRGPADADADVDLGDGRAVKGTVATSPAAVLAWLDAQTEPLLALVVDHRWRAEARLLQASAGLREMYLGELRQGRSVAARVRLAAQVLVVMRARAVGVEEAVALAQSRWMWGPEAEAGAGDGCGGAGTGVGEREAERDVHVAVISPASAWGLAR